MTPTIYKLAYSQTDTTDGYSYVLFQNDGNLDVFIRSFRSESDLLSYLRETFIKVGKITDYGLYIRSLYDVNA